MTVTSALQVPVLLQFHVSETTFNRIIGVDDQGNFWQGSIDFSSNEIIWRQFVEYIQKEEELDA